MDAVMIAAAIGGGRRVFVDGFNRANENLETNASWTRTGGTAGALTVDTNQARITSTTSTLYLCPEIGKTDHFAQAELRTVTGSPGGIVARGTDSNNYVFARYNGTTGAIQLFKNVANVFTELGATSITANIGDVVRIEARGDNVRVLINGIERIAPTSLSGDHASSTRAGLVARAALANPYVDNFKAGAL